MGRREPHLWEGSSQDQEKTFPTQAAAEFLRLGTFSFRNRAARRSGQQQCQ